MSPSTKSKPASPSSPATGAESKGADKGDKDAKGSTRPFREENPDRDPQETVTVELEISRQRWMAWAIGGVVGGALLIWKLGTVGVWAGYVLIALGLFRGYQLVMSLIHPAGKIIVTPKQITLPRAIHRPKPLQLEPSDVTAVYFLRRSVPWNRSAPVLIVELRGAEAMVFPRDWFPSEAEQRRVLNALLSHLPHVRREPEAGDTAEPAKAAPSTTSESAPAAAD